MSTLCCEPPTRVDVEQEYRSTFAEFSKKLRTLQALSSERNPDPKALQRASFELELARERYALQRDALAQRFLR